MTLNWVESTRYSGFFNANIGNYIRLDLYPRNKGTEYALYLHIRKWKEDGCKENKLCQAQEVAAFKTADPNLAKANAERWFQGFVKDMIAFSGMGITDLL